MDKIDIYDTEAVYDKALESLMSEEEILLANRKHIKKFLMDSAIGKTAKLNARVKKVGSRARLKNLFLLKKVGLFYTKDFKELTNKDIESLIHAIESNRLKAAGEKKNLSEQTKANIKRQFIIFLRWLLGDGKKFYEMTHWIDLRYKKRTMPSLDEKEIKEILQKCGSIKQKVLIACLFDGGFRIEEFLNVRNDDIKLIEGDVPYYRIVVRNEFSKTAGREVSMLWSESYDIIKAWIDSKTESLKPEEQFYNCTYGGVKSMLSKLSNKTGKHLNAHQFRHSSALFYVNQGFNEFQINKRYGWSNISDIGRRYVDEKRVEEANGKQIKVYEDNKLADLKGKLHKQEEATALLRNQLESETAKKNMDIEDLKERLKKNEVQLAKTTKASFYFLELAEKNPLQFQKMIKDLKAGKKP